jgi:hypothetical protein
MKRHRWLLFLLPALLLACSILAPSNGETPAGPSDGSSGGSTDIPEDQPAATSDSGSGPQSPYDQISKYAGRWTGTWNNTSFGSSGDIDVTIEIMTDGTASLSLDVTGNALGAGSMPQLVIVGYYDSNGLFFMDPSSPVFGNLKIAIPPNGQFISMQAELLPGATIAAVSATGMLNEDEITIEYAVNLTAGGNLALGTATLTHSP